MRGRDAATTLHTFDSRDQDVVVANWFVQDAFTPGYTLLVNVHHSADRGPIAGAATSEAAEPGKLSATYLGIHGDGRWGAWNVSHAFYQVFGSDDLNPFAGAAVDISAQMAALELSRDADWKRWRLGLFFASGDDTPGDDSAGAFDAIVDNPNFAGGDFMFWSSQAATIQGASAVNTQSLLPNLRNKFNQRANYVNPGLFFVNGGLDLRVSPKLEIITNVSWLRFAKDFFQTGDTSIGVDVGAGVEWRPLLNENVKVLVGAAGLIPSKGFEALGVDETLFSAFVALQLAY
jgi:hypothetical protein